jgi:hypothetical protein
LNGEHDQIVFRQTSDDGLTNQIPEGFSFADPIDPRAYPTDGQRRQLEAIAQELSGRGEAASIGDEGLMAVRVVDAVYRSSAEGQPIDIAGS